MAISLRGYLMGRQVEYPPTLDMLADAQDLLDRVEALMKDLGFELQDEDVSSGYRPGKYNNVKGAAPKSGHTRCIALDIKDKKGRPLKTLITVELLDKHDLYMEDPKWTPKWCHLDIKYRVNRIFKPF